MTNKPRQHTINEKIKLYVNLLLTTELTQKQISGILLINPSTLSRWKKRDDFIELFEKTRKTLYGE